MISKEQLLNLNNFKKLGTLERAEFGVILCIEEISTGNIYAAKIPNNNYAKKINISREIEILQLDHPSINKLIGFCPFDFDNNRHPVIVTNFYTNRTLLQVLELNKDSQQHLNPWNNTKKLINIFGIASAMSFLHLHHTIHRDLTPINILEDDYLYPQITNFSLSQNIDDTPRSDNSVSKVSFYMAPELFVNKNSYSFASDVYSYSLIMYEILTNEVPFQKLKTIDILIRVIKQNFRPNINTKSVPKFFQNLITRCWSQDPKNRPSFNEITQLLRNTNDFKNEFSIDENEYLNYIKYIDDYFDHSNTNKSLDFSEQCIEKVSLFQKIYKEPLSLNNVDTIDLSKYKQLENIGEGSFGAVYEVFNLENGQKFAAKVFKRKIYKNSENRVKINFLKNEVEILKKLNHPSIIKFIGFNPLNFNNLPYPVILTEYAVNRSLESVLLLERNGLATQFWDETKKLISIYGIASSMSYLHSQNIIHRNLKPSNILMDELIHPKLADFGLSKILSNNSNEVEDKGNFLLGTYDYIAPEIYENMEYSKSSDVFAFALILYEIMTNQKPFLGSNVSQIINNLMKGFRPEINSEIPDCYKKLIQECWSQNSRDRPTFESILKQLRTDKSFITDHVKEEEFHDYVYKIDKHQFKFDSKVLQTIDYETIYRKQKVVLITDGIIDLKNYTKKERISKDNYSTTYKIIEKGKSEILLAKESNIEINYLCKEEINNLTKDISLLSSMNHPYILKVIGFSTTNFENIHKPVILTEYASNRTLEDLIDIERNGLLLNGWNDTKKLINIYGIAYCMSYLHSHDILHFNLNPSNIIIDENYHPKIMGFGFYRRNLMKKCIEIQSIYNPKENFVYSIPEVLSSGKFTKESDVYSFGLIVYELITNKKPFFEYDNNVIQLLKKIEENSYRPTFNDSMIACCYKELIERCWSQDPLKRPSFDEIVSILKKDTRFITSLNIDKDEYDQFVSQKYVEPEHYDLQQLMNQADNNDPKALFRFGLLYSKGIAMPLNQTKAARFYEKAAALGYAQAQCNLGKMYLRGYGVPQNKEKAIQLFEQAAKQGDAKAWFNLGVLYFKGNGVEQDYSKAVEYYEKAVELNDPEAQFNLGQMFNNGEGVSVDKKRAFDLFTKSAKYGNSSAQFNLGLMYQNGIDDLLNKDVNMSIQMYKKAADQNFAQANFNLALLYLNGDTGVPINKEKAKQLFEKAVSQGYEEAKLYLDPMYSKSGNQIGFQIENIFKSLELKIESVHNSIFTSFFTDFKSTLNYIDNFFVEKIFSEFLCSADQINKSLKKFNSETLNLLNSNKRSFPSLNIKPSLSPSTVEEAGNELVSEVNRLKLEVYSLESRLNQLNKQIQNSIESDSSNSSSSPAFSESSKIRNILKKADAGDAKSQLLIAAFYATGKGGVHLNNGKALKYYLMAADQGNMNAQYAAASYFYYGRGTKEDKNRAFELFLKAAEQGHSKAQFALGHFYQFDKDNIQQNQENAMNWYKKAAQQGHEAAKKILNENFDDKK